MPAGDLVLLSLDVKFLILSREIPSISTHPLKFNNRLTDSHPNNLKRLD
jgi:hypothetical protein